MQRIYIDANTGLGRVNYKEGRIPHTIESLTNDMKYFRVHAALIYSQTARDYSYVKGNKQLMEEIESNRRLFGAAV